MAKAKRDIIYKFRGMIEVPSGGTYRWTYGYSEDSPNGGVYYPWMQKRACQRDAKAQGGKAVFAEDRNA